jgi:hypothetical protein
VPFQHSPVNLSVDKNGHLPQVLDAFIGKKGID